MRHPSLRLVALFVCLFVASASRAQEQIEAPFDPQAPFGPGIIGQFDATTPTGDPATITTQFTAATTDRAGCAVTLELVAAASANRGVVALIEHRVPAATSDGRRIRAIDDVVLATADG